MIFLAFYVIGFLVHLRAYTGGGKGWRFFNFEAREWHDPQWRNFGLATAVLWPMYVLRAFFEAIDGYIFDFFCPRPEEKREPKR